jgi:hypothetical protein
MLAKSFYVKFMLGILRNVLIHLLMTVLPFRARKGATREINNMLS